MASKSKLKINCGVCNKKIDTNEYLTCITCHKHFDVECTSNIGIKYFRLMTSKSKDKWQCHICLKEIKTKNVEKNPETKRLRPRVNRLNKEINCDPSISTAIKSIPLTVDNATISKKPPKGASTPTSVRQQPQGALNDSTDHDSIHSDVNSSNSITPSNSDSCEYTSIEKLTRSVETLSDIYSIQELKQEIGSLKDKLESTQNELDNTILENNALNRKIEALSKEVKVLKDICKNPLISARKKENSNKLQKSRINFGFNSLNNTPSNATQKNYIKSNTIPGLTYESPVTKQHELQTEDLALSLNNKISLLMNNLSDAQKEIETLRETIMELEIKLHAPTKTECTKASENKRQLCIISNNKRNKILQIAENTFQDTHNFCHYKVQGGGIRDLLFGIDMKVKNFTKRDCCVLIIGETDFVTSNKYYEMVALIRETLQQQNHTNFIICLPTYRFGYFTEIYNQRIETFNNLLYLDIQKHQHAYHLDSNLDLSTDFQMFSRINGTLKDQGMRNIFANLKKFMKDIEHNITSSGDHNVGMGDNEDEVQEVNKRRNCFRR